MSAIKERPILFSAPMVRAILEGRKTVTRRALNSQALKNIGYGVRLGECHELPTEGPLHPNSVDYYNDFCPFGRPGDRLWVRETHADIGCRLTYRADTDDGAHCQVKKWTPAIHMFRRHSRILLEITDVRVERLQDISEEQAKAEGCFFTDYGQACFHGGRGIRDATECEYPASKHQQRPGWMWDKTNSYEQCLDSARHAFGNLWNSVGGDWGANPWVWVVEFKRVKP